MSEGLRVNIIERSQVSAPPHSTSPTSLPLTFLDLPWLFFSPNQPLFFFDFPFSLTHFIAFTLPNLKLSLSLTLQHYFPFAGNFVPSLEPSKPHIVYSESNSVSLVVAESSDDFNYFCSNHARDVNSFHALVSNLKSEKKEIALMAIQVTVFPDSGICIGITYQNIIADGRTFHNFMNTWAAFCSSQDSSFPQKSLPFYDRGVIVDSHGLEEVFLKQYWRRKRTNFITVHDTKVKSSSLSDVVRATFLMGPTQMENIKRFIVSSCREKNESQPEHLSPYVLACAFLWVCMLKTQQITNNNSEDVRYKDPAYFGFIAGGMTRLQFPVPATYLGNCVGFGLASAMRGELLREDGIVVAARAIGGTIKKLDQGMLVGAEKWVSDWEGINGSELHVVATWSPKLKLYGTDFGWGGPRKIEEISIDKSRAISLISSRDVVGGMEIGLALPRDKMDSFTVFFNQGLVV
ncbi:hypothetical protein QN277_002209 [Acacia crassicarpa]|uniref:Anthocyanin 5-aromatic acyltransferase n=1 Tax=Acacia crassicarpa TaxID=499986 RepID=A0AAE1N8Q0_9FABA|nr:hypothetical protein QN277_002209 [Acacia crassicarpa]